MIKRKEIIKNITDVKYDEITEALSMYHQMEYRKEEWKLRWNDLNKWIDEEGDVTDEDCMEKLVIIRLNQTIQLIGIVSAEEDPDQVRG